MPGGSNSAVAEYAVTAASTLLRRFAWADAEIKAGNYAAVPRPHGGRQSRRHRGLLVGVVGFGMIGRAVAQAFVNAGCRICYFDPAPADPAAAQASGAQAMPLDELLRPPTW